MAWSHVPSHSRIEEYEVNYRKVAGGPAGFSPKTRSATDYRVNYRLSASESWMFGNYVTSESFGNRRPQTTVPRSGALRCNTAYEFQVEVKVLGRGSGWHDYGTFTARAGGC